MSRVSSLVLVALLGSLLVGCTTVGEDLEPTGEVPSTVESTVPAWTDEELSVIEAVENYLQVWVDISQNLSGADFSRILDVATHPVATDVQLQWADWVEGGWHLEGSPIFTIDYITISGFDDLGQRFHVHGCYSIENVYLVDAVGQKAEDRGIERGTALYEVIRDTEGQYLVLSDDGGEIEPC